MMFVMMNAHLKYWLDMKGLGILSSANPANRALSDESHHEFSVDCRATGFIRFERNEDNVGIIRVLRTIPALNDSSVPTIAATSMTNKVINFAKAFVCAPHSFEKYV
jgi:hypothetical protein